MSSIRVALPPGVYYIEDGQGKAVVDPATLGSQLYTAKKSATALNQQWQISGNGIAIGMDNPTTAFVYVGTPSIVQAQVTRNQSTATPWIINVVANNDGTYTGTIMTNDGLQNFWGITADKIALAAESTDFVFTPVPHN